MGKNGKRNGISVFSQTIFGLKNVGGAWHDVGRRKPMPKESM